jgi:hypothetical protein
MNPENKSGQMSRRGFLKLAAGLGFGLAASQMGLPITAQAKNINSLATPVAPLQPEAKVENVKDLLQTVDVSTIQVVHQSADNLEEKTGKTIKDFGDAIKAKGIDKAFNDPEVGTFTGDLQDPGIWELIDYTDDNVFPADKKGNVNYFLRTTREGKDGAGTITQKDSFGIVRVNKNGDLIEADILPLGNMTDRLNVFLGKNNTLVKADLGNTNFYPVTDGQNIVVIVDKTPTALIPVISLPNAIQEQKDPTAGAVYVPQDIADKFAPGSTFLISTDAKTGQAKSVATPVPDKLQRIKYIVKNKMVQQNSARIEDVKLTDVKVTYDVNKITDPVVRHNPVVEDVAKAGNITIEIGEYNKADHMSDIYTPVSGPKAPDQFGNYSYMVSYSKDGINIRFSPDAQLSKYPEYIKAFISRVIFAAAQQKVDEKNLLTGDFSNRQISAGFITSENKILANDSLNKLSIVDLSLQ